jgi:uncharacterized protein
MSTGKRLYVRFTTGSGFYVYDTSSNQILRVSAELWDVLDEYLATRSEPLAVGAASERRGSLPFAYRQIQDGLSQGFLGPCSVESMCFYREDAELDLRDVREAITQQIGHVTLELTEACNARCHYCPYAQNQQRSASPRRMNWTTLTNALAVFMSHNHHAKDCSVSFWGGEPLLELPLMRGAVEHIAREYPHRAATYQLTTNGTLFTEAAVRFLIDHDVTVMVSLDGPAIIQNRYRRLHSGEPTFDRIVAGLQKILSSDPDYYRTRVRFHCVLTPGVDVRLIGQFFAQHRLCRGHSVTFQPVGPTRPFETCALTFTDDDERSVRASMRDEVVAIEGNPATPLAMAGVRSFLPIATRPRSKLGAVVHPNGCCVPLLEKMFVAVSGNIYLCERLDYDNCLGNVNSSGVDVDAAVRLVRQYCRHSIDECRECWAVRLCKTCYRDFISQNTWSPVRRAATCDASRMRTLDTLKDYVTVLESNEKAFDHLNQVV